MSTEYVLRIYEPDSALDVRIEFRSSTPLMIILPVLENRDGDVAFTEILEKGLTDADSFDFDAVGLLRIGQVAIERDQPI